MGGLIPLLLKDVAAGSRGSVIFPASNSTQLSAPPPLPTSSPTMTTSLGSPKSRVSKRLAPQAPAFLPVLPYTSAEWSKAVSDVKRQYLNRKYRPCSMRCCEILDNIKDTVSGIYPNLFENNDHCADLLFRGTSSRHISSTCTSMPQAHSRCSLVPCKARHRTGRCCFSRPASTTPRHPT